MVIIITNVSSSNNGLAQTPPMGWRSWNQYGPNVTQQLMQHIMAGMVDTSITHGNTSLCNLGYCDVGLDDNWQACDSPLAAPGMHYHDIGGNPIVNETTFPSLKDMTDYAHSLNLTAGFYGNNCICSDHCRNEAECHKQTRADVKSFLEWGFDTWKLDGCGGEISIRLFDEYIRELSPEKPIMIENCHWGLTEEALRERHATEWLPPPEVGCSSYNFFRSSGDIRPAYGSILANLNSIEKYRNISGPGCWSYPDMLQVGVRRKEDGVIALTVPETRTHFGSWCIVSSPLLLSHDVYDEEVNDHIWDIISNQEAIAVNQAFAGDSGGVYKVSETTVCIANCEKEMRKELFSPLLDISMSRELKIQTPYMVPTYKYLSKPLGPGKVAVLLMNSKEHPTELTAIFSDIPGLSSCDCNTYSVRDIWAHNYVGRFEKSWSIEVGGHDCAFIVVECT